MTADTPNPIQEHLTRPGGVADRLRQLRLHAGLSGKSLAEAAGWQPSKVSRVELGRQRPTTADIEVWSRACGADSDHTTSLLALLADAESLHREWKRRMRHGQSPVQADYNQIVAGSSIIRHFEVAYVPGLLQTSDYARRVLTEMVDLHGLSVFDVEDAVATRMRRQQLLYDPEKTFEFILAESVLRWMLCPPEVMAGQLDRLQTAMNLPNVRFGIIPFGVQIPVAPQNSFQMYDDIAIIETFVGETACRGTEADAYARVMERLWAQAATGTQARRLIVQAVNLED
jgi:transcriptional regulator with XRE-family HTH domain